MSESTLKVTSWNSLTERLRESSTSPGARLFARRRRPASGCRPKLNGRRSSGRHVRKSPRKVTGRTVFRSARPWGCRLPATVPTLPPRITFRGRTVITGCVPLPEPAGAAFFSLLPGCSLPITTTIEGMACRSAASLSNSATGRAPQSFKLRSAKIRISSSMKF